MSERARTAPTLPRVQAVNICDATLRAIPIIWKRDVIRDRRDCLAVHGFRQRD